MDSSMKYLFRGDPRNAYLFLGSWRENNTLNEAYAFPEARTSLGPPAKGGTNFLEYFTVTYENLKAKEIISKVPKEYDKGTFLICL